MKLPGVRDYPNWIIVNNDPWDLKFTKKSPDDLEDTLGLCHPGEKCLYIKLGQSRREILETFIHELLHAMEDEYEFNIPHKVVGELEKPLADFLIQNADLFSTFILLLFDGSNR
jgi:hypothetical protein